MDSIDAQLLALLQEDCSRSLAALGQRVGLSISAVKDRLRRLRARGDVRAYVALINPQTFGYTTCAFVQVVIEGKKNERAFLGFLLKMPGIQECHHVAGEFCYLVKIWAHDLPDLEHLLEGIQGRPGVMRVQTSVVLSSPKDSVTGLAARP
ncbi:putative Proline dehydrogenase transcriptional activator [Candidatus Sulfopaludibacter sp. SbA3]|nr:putative Proline dehydrogenase transcriptional activator [Candidatus Sulfopaludibacter sp. SbA3]